MQQVVLKAFKRSVQQHPNSASRSNKPSVIVKSSTTCPEASASPSAGHGPSAIIHATSRHIGPLPSARDMHITMRMRPPTILLFKEGTSNVRSSGHMPSKHGEITRNEDDSGRCVGGERHGLRALRWV